MLLKISDLGPRSSNSTIVQFIGFIVLPFLLLVSSGSALIHFGTKTPVTIKVEEKEAIGGGEQSGKYLIYTDEEVFDNRDSVWEMKWNSSDVYRQIEAGNCYRTEAWGYRVSFLSLYRGIDQVKEVGCS